VLFRGSTKTQDVKQAKLVLDREYEKAWNQINFGATEKKRIKFSDAFEAHYRNVWSRSKDPEWYEYMRDSIIRVVGDFYLDEVKGSWSADFVDARFKAGSLQENLKKWKAVGKHSVNACLKIIHTVMLNTDDMTHKMPPQTRRPSGTTAYQIHLLPMTKVERERNTPLNNMDELHELLKNIVRHARPIVLVSFGTGLRKENVMQLNIEQIKWNEGIIEVVQKGGKRHTVALTEALAKLLRTLCEGRTRGPVFRYGQNECDCISCRKVHANGVKGALYGKRIKSIKRSWDTARAAIGREDLRIHDLRHSLGTFLARSSQNLVVIKDILGHEDVRTTQRYLHTDAETTRKALESIDLSEAFEAANDPDIQNAA